MLAEKVLGSKQKDAQAKGSSTFEEEMLKSCPASMNNAIPVDEKEGHSNASPVSNLKEPLQNENRDTLNSNTGLPFFLNFLPIRIECTKGAMTMGNEHTASVLVAHFKSGSGQIDARSAGEKDLYQQSFDFDLEQAMVEIKANVDFKEKQLTAGARSHNYAQPQARQQSSRLQRLRHSQKAILHDAYRLVPILRKSVESFTGYPSNLGEHAADGRGGKNTDRKWLGLPRYLGDDPDGRLEQERWRLIEYAQMSTVAICDTMSVSFYWDVPGLVSTQAADRRDDESQTAKKPLQADDDPAWGLSIRLGKTTISYSPWADRQRAELQYFFFPQTYMDNTVTALPRAGQPRIYTKFCVLVTLDEPATLRILTREESKDWKWRDQLAIATQFDSPHQKKHFFRGKKATKHDPNIRQAGWLDLAVSADSSVSYTMDMIAGEKGFQNSLDLDVRSPSMTTSVNHDLLWQSEALNLNCNLPNPLQWKASREWKFDIRSDGMKLFLLRDHVFLLTDLISDWTSGPSAGFAAFVPFHYAMSVQFTDFQGYLNVNDLNIINRPTSMEDNSFVILRAEPLAIEVGIPMLNFQPLQNKISFKGNAEDVCMALNTPSWNTQNTFLDSKEFASLQGLHVDGSYDYCTSTSPSLTDTLVLNVRGDKPILHAHGVVIRHFLILEANYLGKDMHFQTLEEYQQSIDLSHQRTGSREEARRIKESNDLDVILNVEADESFVRLPALLYSVNPTLSPKSSFHQLLHDSFVDDEPPGLLSR